MGAGASTGGAATTGAGSVGVTGDGAVGAVTFDGGGAAGCGATDVLEATDEAGACETFRRSPANAMPAIATTARPEMSAI